MAFADVQALRTIVKGYGPAEITLGGDINTGDLIGNSSGWVRADANAVILPTLIAGSSGASGDRITAYASAIVRGAFGATDNATVYASDTAGCYSETASTTTILPVGIAMNGTDIWVNPTAKDAVMVGTAKGSLVAPHVLITDVGTARFAGSPFHLLPGANTVACSVAGSATITYPAGCVVVAATDTMTVTGSPKTSTWGSTSMTITTTGSAGNITITVTALPFAWHNPLNQDILIKRVVLDVTTAGGTATADMDVGIADDAIGTNLGAQFFASIDINGTAQVYDSWTSADGGAQVGWIKLQDSASAIDGWILGAIDTEKANTLAGKYYIDYIVV